jgi:hypothetical protein
MSDLMRGDRVSWDGDTWTVEICGYEFEVMEDGSNGGPLVQITNDARGMFTVRESDVTVTAWAPTAIARQGDESRPQ